MAQEKHGILPLRMDSWFNCKEMSLGLEQTLINHYVWVVYGSQSILEWFWEKFMENFGGKISDER